MVSQKRKESRKASQLLNEFGGRKRCSKSLEVSFFWTEKLYILIHFLQLFILIFLTNYDNWPTFWRGLVSYSNVSLLSLDLTTYLYDEILNSQTNRSIYLGSWILFVVALGFLRRMKRNVYIEKGIFFFVSFMYYPLILALIPGGICTFDGCWESILPSTVSALSLLIGLVVGVLVPFYFFAHAYSHSLVPDSEAHEDYMRLREVEFVLKLSSVWLNEKLYYISSFRRSYLRVYHRPIFQLLLFYFLLLRGAFDTEITMGIISVTLGLLALYVSFFPVYRCLSSSLLYSVSTWILFSNAFVGYMKVSGSSSHTLVDSNLSALLIFINFSGIVFLAMMMIVFSVFALGWPVTFDTFKGLAIGYRHMLVDLRNAQEMIVVLRNRLSFLFLKTEPIEEMIGILSGHYRLLYKEGNFLQFCVVEQMDNLSYLLGKVLSKTLLPCKKLEENLGDVVNFVNRRWNNLIDMSTKKRVMLLKMNVLSIFLGKKKLGPIGKEKPRAKTSIEMDTSSNFNTPRIVKEDSELLEKIIDKAAEENDIEKLIKISQQCSTNNYSEVIETLRRAWERVGYQDVDNLFQETFRQWLDNNSN